MCSLYLSLMDKTGVRLDSFGDSKERLAEIGKRETSRSIASPKRERGEAMPSDVSSSLAASG